MRFRELYSRMRLPRWMRLGESELVLYSLGAMMDFMAERFRQSYEARLPDRCGDDALDLIARDRNIVRGDAMTRERYVEKTLGYLAVNDKRGSPYALIEELWECLYKVGVLKIYVIDANGTRYFKDQNSPLVGRQPVLWQWDDMPNPPNWSRFWVDIEGKFSHRWNPSMGARHGTTSVTVDQIASVMRVIRDWMPAGARCEWVMIGNWNPNPNGKHGTWSAWDGTKQRPVRHSSMRYWIGPR
jgi:hypothetical protein